MDAMQILVVILSIFLALFLLLAIILVTLLIKVTRQIRSVTTTAESTVKQFSSFAGNLSKVTSPAIIGKLILDQIKKARK